LGRHTDVSVFVVITSVTHPVNIYDNNNIIVVFLDHKFCFVWIPECTHSVVDNVVSQFEIMWFCHTGVFSFEVLVAEVFL